MREQQTRSVAAARSAAAPKKIYKKLYKKAMARRKYNASFCVCDFLPLRRDYLQIFNKNG
jgi:hypothetical protein